MVNIKKLNELPDGSGTLTNDDILLFMDDPSGSGVTKKISLSEISSAIGGANPFDQNLNTTDSPTFSGVNLSNNSSLSEGSFDSGIGGNGGISLNCVVGYELNWQAGHLRNIVTGDNTGTPQVIYVDSDIQFPTSGGIIDNATLKNYREVMSAPSIVSSGLTIDLSQGNVFLTTLNSNITNINIINVDSTSNRSQGFTLVFTMDGTARSVTWPTSVKWPGSGVPVLSSGNLKQDVFSFVTHTNGSGWLGFIGGYEY